MTLPLAEAYSPNYSVARDRFRARARAAGAQLTCHPVHVEGYDDAALSIDVAQLGESASTTSVVVSSGLHGVEGFFGAALQLDALARCEQSALDLRNVRLILVHTLNPYGFAATRRTNEDNVDLNRNFLENRDDYHGCPEGYAELEELLNPRSRPRRWDGFRLRALLRVLRHGEEPLRRAIASGQYESSRGLFFGGHETTATATTIQELAADWITTSREVIHLDLHSGLGPHGACTLLLAEPPDAAGVPWFRRHFAPLVEPYVAAGGTAYPARGLLGQWLLAHNGDTVYRFATAEFGTYSGLRVLETLRAENRAHHYGKPDTPLYRHAKRALLECFCPAAPRWRRQVLEVGGALIEQAIRAAG